MLYITKGGKKETLIFRYLGYGYALKVKSTRQVARKVTVPVEKIFTLWILSKGNALFIQNKDFKSQASNL